MTDQIDMIYLKIFLYFGIYQNHLQRISADGLDINRNIGKFLNKSCEFDLSF